MKTYKKGERAVLARVAHLEHVGARGTVFQAGLATGFVYLRLDDGTYYVTRAANLEPERAPVLAAPAAEAVLA